MKDLINRGILYLLCLVPFLHNFLSLSCIAVCLAVLSLNCLISCLPSQKYICILTLLYAILAIPFPYLTYFLPLCFYNIDIAHKKNLPVFILLAGTSCICFWHTAPEQTGYMIIVILTACLLQYYHKEIHNTKNQFHKYRDDSVEASLYLKEKHNALLAQQDYELHVATLTERNRIAREIHDNVGHLLTSSILQTGALQVINKDQLLDSPLQNLSDTLNCAILLWSNET